MRRVSYVRLLVSLTAILSATPIFAHHGFNSEFDKDKAVTLRGTLSKIDWINPHIYFYLDVKDADGKVTQWTLESFPTGFMHRAGITRDTFTIGEPVTVLAYTAKDSTRAFGWMQELTLASGRKLVFANAEHPPTDPANDTSSSK